jgi:hypothetical protein
MAASQGAGLRAADPRVGQTLSFDGREWEVTDHSSYWDAEGYRVTEWCCEAEDVEAYLLKEVKEGEPVRWFFTRKVPRDAVAGLGAGRPAAPPDTLTHEGRPYRFDEATEGTYEEEPGERVAKTTWEYWDAAHRQNVAVELWADGRVDCYRGAYIEPGEVTLGGEAAAGGGESAGAQVQKFVALAARARGAIGDHPGVSAPGNPFVVAPFAFAVGYALPFFGGRPFDECLVVAVPAAAALGWLTARSGARGALWVGLAGLLVASLVFLRFPPLSHPIGLTTLVAAPAAVGWWGRRHGARGRRGVLFVAALVVALPAFALGAYHYFSHAPGPHTLAQLALALGPAAIGAAVALLVSRLVLAGDPETA